MKIKLKDFVESLTVEISGREEWLTAIYQGFPVPGDQVPPIAAGSVTLRKLGYDVVQITGVITYEPFLQCSRCSDSIKWPLKADIAAICRPTPVVDSEKNVLDLRSEELDDYFLQGDEIDLEPLINDAIYTALPSSILKSSEDGKLCLICGEDLSSTKVCSVGETPKESPFKDLQKLLDQKR